MSSECMKKVFVYNSNKEGCFFRANINKLYTHTAYHSSANILIRKKSRGRPLFYFIPKFFSTMIHFLLSSFPSLFFFFLRKPKQMLHSWSKDSMPSKRVRSHNNSASTSRSTAEDISMDVAITAALARSFQVSGVDTNLEDIKMDVDRMNTSLSSIEERLSRMENKIDFILEKYESVTLTYTEPLEAAEFIPKGTLHNEISVSKEREERGFFFTAVRLNNTNFPGLDSYSYGKFDGGGREVELPATFP